MSTPHDVVHGRVWRPSASTPDAVQILSLPWCGRHYRLTCLGADGWVLAIFLGDRGFARLEADRFFDSERAAKAWVASTAPRRPPVAIAPVHHRSASPSPGAA